MNGYNATVGTINGGSNAVIDIVSSGGTSTLTVGNPPSLTEPSPTGTFGGVIQNTTGILALTKIGPGTQTLSGANTYSGTTTVIGGTLALTGNGTLGRGNLVIANGGTVDLGGTTQTLNGGVNWLAPAARSTPPGTTLRHRVGGVVGNIQDGTLNVTGGLIYFQSGALSADLEGSSQLSIGGDANATVYLGGNPATACVLLR